MLKFILNKSLFQKPLPVASFLCILFLIFFIEISCSDLIIRSSELIPPLRDTIDAQDPNIKYIGRFDFRIPHKASCEWPGSTIKVRFWGRFIGFRFNYHPYLQNENYTANYYNLTVDSANPIVIKIQSDTTIYINRIPFREHVITLNRRTEAFCGRDEIAGIYVERGTKLLTPLPSPERRIEYIGDSQICGYGNEETDPMKSFTSATENCDNSFAALSSKALGAESFIIGYSGSGLLQDSNGGTITIPTLYQYTCALDSTGLWDFSRWIPDCVVIDIGINDFGMKYPDSVRFVNTYLNFIKNIRKNYPAVPILCLTGPMKNQAQYRSNATTEKSRFVRYVKAVSASAEKAGLSNVSYFALSPMDSILGVGANNHPNVYQHKKNAAELAKEISRIMGW